MKRLLWIVVFTIVIAGILYVVKNYGKNCGGIAANLPPNVCAPGFVCSTDSSKPDALGKCVFSLDFLK